MAPRPNGDGIVLATDVTQMRRFSTGLDTPGVGTTEGQRADSAPRGTLGDGIINSGDVIQARRYSTGLDPLTPVGGPTGPTAISESSPTVFDSLYMFLFGREVRIGEYTFGERSLIVPVEITPFGDESALSFTMEYDSASVANPRVTLGDAFVEGVVLTVNDLQPGKLGILVDSSLPMIRSEKARTVVYVTFDILDDSVKPAVSFSDQLAVRSISDANGDPILATWR